MPRRIFIGTAGWSIPRASAHRFDDEGTHLQRYARVFAGVEINLPSIARTRPQPTRSGRSLLPVISDSPSRFPVSSPTTTSCAAFGCCSISSSRRSAASNTKGTAPRTAATVARV